MGVEYFDCWADHVDHAMADYREWCLTMKDTGYAGMSDAEVGDIGTAAEDCDAFYVYTHTHTHKIGGLPIHPATAIFPKNQ